MSLCTKIRKHLSADCCQLMRSSLLCHTYTQNAARGMYKYATTDCHIFRTQKREYSCVSYTRMKSVLLRWTPSLNDRSKLKGECTDVKSGCGKSVGPRPPQSRLKQNSRDTVPLNCWNIFYNSFLSFNTVSSKAYSRF